MNPSLSIALWEHNQPLVAVVHAPALGETFTAIAGENWLHGNRIIAGNPAIHEYLCKCVIEDVHPDRLEA